MVLRNPTFLVMLLFLCFLSYVPQFQIMCNCIEKLFSCNHNIKKIIDGSDRFCCENQNIDSKKDFLFFLWDQNWRLQPQVVAKYTVYLFFAISSFFTQDFYFLICFACVYINVEIFIYNIVSVSGK